MESDNGAMYEKYRGQLSKKAVDFLKIEKFV